ncbi:hypothetical protein LNKW23_36380 [Paralimibaculum aggregatum]|uniref:Uncharacterized protein n=1 Tax=Paralimibaculum aggregatum TaxID=3036245 RepID=A0ABQ6LMJ4_9RHOB|nr:hypothetical protein [Limibaculum sp. NKW23]GMG84422.1 hypothetical protein LNKW23_36380 [Limibaculum sp. NKW23]
MQASQAKDFFVSEFKHMLPPTIFFIICFNVIALTVALLAEGREASLGAHAGATLAGMVCGKAVLVADRLPFFNRYPQYPLIWNALWKTLLYVAVTFAFRLLEKLLSAATGEYGFSAGVAEHVAHFEWSRFFAIQLWLLILFFLYTAFGELVGQVGRARIMQMFFGPVAPGAAEPGGRPAGPS